MIRKIESLGTLFCEGWELWLPDPSWPIPQLPNDWFDVDGMKPGT